MDNPLETSGISPDLCRMAVQQVGTPLFLYSADLMKRRLSEVRELLGDEFEVLYSIKANPSLAIARMFCCAGTGAEVSSGGELEIALAAGFDPGRILMCGPGKVRAEIDLAVARQVLLSVESEREAGLIEETCARAGTRARVLLRINPGRTAGDARLQMGGITQFGMDYDLARRVLMMVTASKRLSWEGFHCYMGTQILEADQIIANTNTACDMMESLAGEAARDVAVADVGGGFGVPYYPGDAPLDVRRACVGLTSAVDRRRTGPFARTKFIVELGRYLVAEAGVYVTGVVDVKRNTGRTFVVTDGGVNHFLPAGAIGRVVRRNLPLGIVPPRRVGTMTVDVVGPLCTPLDLLARNVELPAVEPGDLVAIPAAGAYGLSASPHSWLSHRMPAEVVVDGDWLHVARQRGRFGDALVSQALVFDFEGEGAISND